MLRPPLPIVAVPLSGDLGDLFPFFSNLICVLGADGRDQMGGGRWRWSSSKPPSGLRAKLFKDLWSPSTLFAKHRNYWNQHAPFQVFFFSANHKNRDNNFSVHHPCTTTSIVYPTTTITVSHLTMTTSFWRLHHPLQRCCLGV